MSACRGFFSLCSRRGLIAAAQRVEFLLGLAPHFVGFGLISATILEAGQFSFSLDVFAFSHVSGLPFRMICAENFDSARRFWIA